MFITQITITCKCSKCGVLTINKSNVSLSPLSTESLTKIILALGYEDDICSLCFSNMIIEDIECKITKNVYGDIQRGEWFCPKHPSDKYYPSPLEKVGTDPTYSTLTRYESYKKIVTVGFPWKCPICNSILTYVERGYVSSIYG